MADSARSFGGLFNSFGGMRNMQGMGPVADTSEQVYISSLALLKMLRHGRVLSMLDQLINKIHTNYNTWHIKYALQPIQYYLGGSTDGSHGSDARRLYRRLYN